MNDSVCRRVREIAPKYHSTAALTVAVNDELGLELTDSILRDRYRRWAEKTGAPALRDVLGAEGSSFVDEPTVEYPAAPAAELRYPKGVLSSRIPPQNSLIVPWPHDVAPPARITIDSDNHFPHENKAFQAAKLALISDLKPDWHVNAGDHYDFEGISDYARDPGSGSLTLQQEFDSSQGYWESICSSARNVEFILGNHEDRLYRTVIENPAFYGLRAFSFKSLAGLPEKVVVHPFNTQLQIGLCWIEHGHEIPGDNPTHTALNMRRGRATFFGHTHKFGMYNRVVRMENGEVHRCEAWNIGFGGKKPHNTPHIARWAKTVPHWVNGFAMAESYEVDGKWFLRVTPFISDAGCIVYNGRTYRG